jgi:hypothetical protein
LMTEHAVWMTAHPREPIEHGPDRTRYRTAAMISNVDVACRWRGSGGPSAFPGRGGR